MVDNFKSQISYLEALDCLATTAEKLQDSEAKQNFTLKNINTQVISSSYANSLFPPSVLKNKTSGPHKRNDKYSRHQVPSCISEDYTLNISPHISTSLRKDFSELRSPMHSPKTSIYLPARPPNLSRVNPSSSTSDGHPNLSTEPNKSAFDIVSPREGHESSPNGRDGGNTPMSNPPEKPPLLFRVDQPSSVKSSLFETLVQESHKILSTQEEEDNIKTAAAKQIKMSEIVQAESSLLDKPLKASSNKPNEDLKKAKEIVLISPQKKQVKKRKIKNQIQAVSDTRRTHGGPPFNPGSTPPKRNTPESALCTLYEHTLLKMATRGFWSGDRGPLQDVFRLTRVENSDLQYTMSDITEHCYNVVKRKLEAASSECDIMHRHMRSYVDEFDSYLDRIYPVSSVAISIYLPTAVDYAAATWHGIVPTGWSEYRRAVVIREVFEVLYNFSCKLSKIPEYKSSFFDKALPDSTLYPITINNNNNNNNTDTTSDKHTESNNMCKSDEDFPPLDTFNIKYSRAFEALWTHTAPHEPFLILSDIVQLKLREYLEQFPIELYAPPEKAIIVVDNKKYKVKETLGYFRRGVQLVDYSKDIGGTVVDTISTLTNVTMTSAVRKIPPGKISKLVHSDLHLENYTNTILQIGCVVDSNSNQNLLTRVKGRKRRIHKFQPSEVTNKKIKDEFNEYVKEEESTKEKRKSIPSFCDMFQGKTSHEQIDTFNSNNVENKFIDNSYIDNRSNSDENKNISKNENTKDSFLSKGVLPPNPETHEIVHPKPNSYAPDILSSMFFPPGTSGEMFSIHLMIDSYRRAAKYLLDTANHLELVARHGGGNAGSFAKREPKDD